MSMAPSPIPPFICHLLCIFLVPPNTPRHSPPLLIFLYTSCLFFSPHPGWSGSQRSAWSSEYSYWTPAGQRCQPPLPEQQIHGTLPYWSAGPVHWGRKNGQRLIQIINIIHMKVKPIAGLIRSFVLWHFSLKFDYSSLKYLHNPPTSVQRVPWITLGAHLKGSAGELALHEARDCICAAGRLSQVHLYSEAAAKPAKAILHMSIQRSPRCTCGVDTKGEKGRGGAIMVRVEDEWRSQTCS